MANERGLGKGLGALLGDAALRAQEGGSVSLPIAQLEPGLKQPRKRFDDTALDELADSIRLHGVITPLTVRRLSSGYYQIIAGERRWRAAKLAGLDELPAVVIEADDRKVMELGLIENLQREDLNPIEIALGCRTLMEEHGLTQEETARRIGKSRPAVANALRLLSLPAPLQELVQSGALSAGHARALLTVTPAEVQEKLARRIVKEDLSVRQVEALVRKLSKDEAAVPSPAPGMADLGLYLAEFEKSLSRQYARRVKIVPGKKRGRIELEYYNQGDLEALLQLLEKEGAR